MNEGFSFVQMQTKSSALLVATVTLLAACSSNPKPKPEGPAGAGPITTKFVPGACNMDNPAFCETFEKESAGGRGGPLDEATWAVSRWGLPMTGNFRNFARRAATSTDDGMNTPSFCGSPFNDILPGGDLRLCDGVDGGGFASKQLNEVFNDDDSFAFTSMRIRQPFDFADHPATIVFDVDAKRNIAFDSHGWWVEFWLSADPTPMPYHGAPTVGSYARRAIGFQIAPASTECFHQEQPVCNQVGRVVVEKDFKIERDGPMDPNGSFSTADAKLNRFKFVVSKDSVEFWGSNYDSAGAMVKLGVASNLDLDWTRGYIHLQHAQYNAGKAHASSSQSYRWDNVAFDGPAFPTPRAYEARDNDLQVGTEAIPVTQFGYDLVARGVVAPVELVIPGIDLTNALSATLNFNLVTHGNRVVKYTFNGGAEHTLTTPDALGHDDLMRTFSLAAPIKELVAGDNTVVFSADDPGTGNPESIGNVDITVEPSE